MIREFIIFYRYTVYSPLADLEGGYGGCTPPPFKFQK